jgi:hypothetical protein
MATDPNWLYSTIAQSAAAIVAIIGGFITANVLKLSAEKESLVKQANEKRRRLDSMKESHVDVTITNFRDLEKEIPELENRVKTFSYPPNLGWGILVLGFMALFSVFFPVLAILEEWFCIWIKILTFAVFGIGILGVFLYISLEIKRLRRK